MGPSPITDKSVTPFHADRANSWREFRLGGGLNVVVVNHTLPGEPSWRFNAGDVASSGISSSPVVYRNLVLVASNDGSLYAIDAATGSLRWRYAAPDELMTQPVYARGVVVVASGNSRCLVCTPPAYAIPGSKVNEVIAIDIATGKELWRRPILGTGMPTGAIVDSEFVHADGSGSISALDVRTGEFRWETTIPTSFAMSAVIDDPRRIYLAGGYGGYGSGFYALDGTSGSLVWRRAVSPYFHRGTGDEPMASLGSMLFAEYLQPLVPRELSSSGNPFYGWPGSPARQHIIAIDKHSGKILWDSSIASGPAPHGNSASIPLVYRGRLYEGSPVANVVTCLDPANGRVLWQLHATAIVRGGIVALNGVLYFGDAKGYLWAASSATGKVIGRLHEDVTFRVGSPIILNGSLIDGSREGLVLALPLREIRDGVETVDTAPH